MNRKIIWLKIWLSCLIIIGLPACSTIDSGAKTTITDAPQLENALREAITETGCPSAACAIIRGDAQPISAATGRTIIGGQINVNTSSLYHIGSVTKSITALITAELVEEGKLNYKDTLGELLPGIPMRKEYARATILDLIASRAGIIPFQMTDREKPEDVEALWVRIPSQYPEDAGAQRRAVTIYALQLPPIQGEGKEAVSVYSNVGWAILGYLLETIDGKSFEEMLFERIIKPLGITEWKVGGWPRDDYDPSEPVGHYIPEDSSSEAQSMNSDDNYIFPAWMNPAGGVSMSITAFSIYVTEHLQGLMGRGKLLSLEGYQFLHSSCAEVDSGIMYQEAPANSTVSLAHGWVLAPFDTGYASAAEGSGGTFYAFAIVYPANEFAFVGLCNYGEGMPVFMPVLEASYDIQFD